jgi:hypothetical protein
LDDRYELLLDEVRTRVSLLKNSLPRELDGFAISPQSKLPFKVLLYRETLIWRMAELSEGACHHFEADDLISAIVLTRASVETTAALWHLHGNVNVAVSSGSVGDIGTYLMKTICGTSTVAVDSGPRTTPSPRPVKIGKFLEAVERDIEGLSRQYGVLSDYAHPNWAGTTLTYTETDQITALATFGKNVRCDKYTRTMGVSNLSVALGMFETSYNSLSDLLPQFVQLCEENIASGKVGEGGQ